MAGGTELATAYVTILPSTRGLGASLIQDLAGPVGAAGKAAGASITNGLSAVPGSLGGLFKSVSKFTVGLGGASIAALAAGKAIGSALDGATSAASDYGQQVVLIQRLTGASAKESSTWAAILGRFGVEGRAASLVVKSLSTEIANQGKNLNAVGVATQNADGSNRTTTAVLGDLAEAYKNATDKTDILAAGSKALGRGFTALLPVLANGKQGIEDLAAEAQKDGLIFSQSDIQAVIDYNKALKDNEDSTKGLAVQAGLATLPVETFKNQAIGALLEKLHETNPELVKLGVGIGEIASPLLTAAGYVGGAAVAIKLLGIGAGVAGVFAYALAAAIGAAGGAAVGFALYKIPAVQQALKGLSDATEDATGKFSDQKNAFLNFIPIIGPIISGANKLGNLWGSGALTAGSMGDAVAAAGGDLSDMTGAASDTAAAIEDATAAWQAETLAMSDGRNANEAALANVAAVRTAEDELTAAIKQYGKHSPEAALATMKLHDAQKLAAQTADDMTYAQARAAVKNGTLTKTMVEAKLKSGELTGKIGLYIAKLLHIPKSKTTQVIAEIHDSALNGFLGKLAKIGIGKGLGFTVTGKVKAHMAGAFVPSPEVALIGEQPEYVINPRQPSSASLITSAARDAGMIAPASSAKTIVFNNYAQGVTGGAIVQQINAALNGSGEMAGYRAVMGATS